MTETKTESVLDNNSKEAGATVAFLTSDVKVLSIENQMEYFDTKKPTIKFDKQIFMEDSRKHFGQLLMGNRAPFMPKERFMTDLFDMNTIEKDNQPRQYQFDCYPCASPGSSMDSTFGQTFYAKAVMHELRKRLKNHKWVSNNVLEYPKNIIGRSYYRYEEDYYVQNIVHDILQEQKLKVFQFLLYLHREYVNERPNSKKS
ncbi:uncharacterized protein LOC111602575 [Drosophila hydei]|uniref:Uncharacterized protein LOC111602575 n=1 Tax=Drosophila hydei TaxID=7224 RepID=A0A6J1MA76_DROHY|nr:uncharacterized protein LOC111602575 [Drosophila hydei]